MLSSAIGALSDRLDAKFLTAYWLPAFVAVFGGFAILTALVGPGHIDAWIHGLDSVEQGIAVLIVLLAITMLAFMLRALTRPIAMLYAGDALPRAVADWSTRGQRRVRQHATRALATSAPPDVDTPASPEAQWLQQAFPRDDADMRPTLFGNILAATTEYSRFVYAMEGALWWPRLSPLLPSYFQEMLGGTQAPMMAMLNLSVVFVVLALTGAALLGLAASSWPAAIIILAGGLLAARLCYRAAVSQATEMGNQLRVAFDLYRHEILRQMDVETPGDLAAERALWQQLTAQMLARPAPPNASAAREPA